ncbi:hypothetical protein KEM60_01438 [Austwickia sp. TVS 96-490-7B]|uniref:MarR family winged helix-turn-helix transcriptional regulator n=1 Tax=Austwickia sp. TVS 96-490-7B TaxID=2830843 RepID=UPI001C59C23D|nr:MarR family transcriptional regulator [Austwickia sp. TVS 96-490-7B]MBW3085241.1 hypothetical protein [Austwickia sp. TVS 96-490-7B]
MHTNSSLGTSESHPAPPTSDHRQTAVDAIVTGSRTLVAVAARSLSSLEGEVTLPQYRALVVLRLNGPARPGDLAAELDVHPSTAGRMVDRLVRKGLVLRHDDPQDRRASTVSLTAMGTGLVDRVTGHRREDISCLVDELTAEECQQVVTGLTLLARAGATLGHVSHDRWEL